MKKKFVYDPKTKKWEIEKLQLIIDVVNDTGTPWNDKAFKDLLVIIEAEFNAKGATITEAVMHVETLDVD